MVRPAPGPTLALGWPCRCGAEVTVEDGLCADCVRAEVAAGAIREAIDHALWLELGTVAFDCLYAEGDDPAWTIEAALLCAAERDREAWSAGYMRAWSVRPGRDSMAAREQVGYWPTPPEVPLTRCVETWWPDDWPDVPEVDAGTHAAVDDGEHCWFVWYPARPVVDAATGGHL